MGTRYAKRSAQTSSVAIFDVSGALCVLCQRIVSWQKAFQCAPCKMHIRAVASFVSFLIIGGLVAHFLLVEQLPKHFTDGINKHFFCRLFFSWLLNPVIHDVLMCWCNRKNSFKNPHTKRKLKVGYNPTDWTRQKDHQGRCLDLVSAAHEANWKQYNPPSPSWTGC